ncbi:hypothetical protein KFE25_007544 [Diacronema lutheri]|uniref:Cytochrome b561 domain-containing protein n=1 Tax=Diacronema lutheri TaxID=2081491 RepID=A0A8J6CFE4_DIALT|nr:hypothetical protein KFE25_007544 [Diacronema lutheri]
MDSDGDGLSNGAELGDPSCVWTVGATPASTTGITHPGVADSATPSASPAPADDSSDSDSGSSSSSTSADDKSKGTATEASSTSTGSTTAAMVPLVPPWLIVHSVFMGIAWLLLAPVGVGVAVLRARVGDAWFQHHQRAMAATSLLAVAGSLVAISSIQSHGASAHSLIGLVLTGLLVVQAVSGFLRPRAHAGSTGGAAHKVPAPYEGSAGAKTRSVEDAEPRATPSTASAASGAGEPHPHEQHFSAQVLKGDARRAWELLHKNGGKLVLVVGLVNVALGIAITVDRLAL